MTTIANQPIITNVRFRDGALGRVFFNDLPYFQGYERDGFSQNGGINHLMVPGENQLLVELLRAPEPRGGRLAFTPDPDPNMGGIDLNQSLEITVFRERAPNTGEVEVLYRTMFPDLWTDIDKDDRRLPYRHTAVFDPHVTVPELAFLTARPQNIPCDGNAGLHDAVRELHQAYVNKDKQRAAAAMALQMTEYERAYGGESGSSMADQLEALDELFAERIVVAPLHPERLHFTGRADGRVVHVERIDGGPVIDIKTIGKPQGHASDPVFTHHHGQWQLM